MMSLELLHIMSSKKLRIVPAHCCRYPCAQNRNRLLEHLNGTGNESKILLVKDENVSVSFAFAEPTTHLHQPHCGNFIALDVTQAGFQPDSHFKLLPRELPRAV